TRLRDILAQFLFRGEDIDKRVAVLSGGERARLGMAKLMLQNHNLLALDEPTNHMDIKSKDILKQALKSFDGTLIVVSHDRDFLDGLVDKLYEFRDGKVREHLGGVAEFLHRRKLENLQELERNTAVKEKTVERKNNALREEMKEKSRQDRKKKNRISYLECEIEKLESRMGEIEKVLSAPGANDDIMELTREYLECKRELDAKTDEWGSLIE
ncbi:MAG: ABC-F family ATP-binding cassette domain-containing protein, partial [Bacteroidales bacterium]|nr:ABC-F family ATP-binding cassette domain-containing protein [Bacteroidales bacterium]